MTFSEKLQKLRKEKGLSQEQLSELLGATLDALVKDGDPQTDAVGAVSIGMFSFGAVAVASHLAVGSHAYGHIAVGSVAEGVKQSSRQRRSFFTRSARRPSAL